jgi:hypothetical protein
MNYRIRVKGHLDLSWQSWLEGLRIEHEVSGTTVLQGSLPDQASLYGVLLKIDRIGLTLLDLQSSATRSEARDAGGGDVTQL